MALAMAEKETGNRETEFDDVAMMEIHLRRPKNLRLRPIYIS